MEMKTNSAKAWGLIISLD